MLARRLQRSLLSLLGLMTLLSSMIALLTHLQSTSPPPLHQPLTTLKQDSGGGGGGGGGGSVNSEVADLMSSLGWKLDYTEDGTSLRLSRDRVALLKSLLSQSHHNKRDSSDRSGDGGPTATSRSDSNFNFNYNSLPAAAEVRSSPAAARSSDSTSSDLNPARLDAAALPSIDSSAAYQVVVRNEDGRETTYRFPVGMFHAARPAPSPAQPSTSLGSADAVENTVDGDSEHDRYVKSLIDLEPRVDHSPRVRSDTDLLLKLANETNLPIVYWNKIKKLQAALKPSSTTNAAASSSSSSSPVSPSNPNGCAIEFPSLFELEYNNIYWQTLRTRHLVNETNFYIYNAYYDDRWRGGPLANVRLLAMIDRVSPPQLTCQLWFDRLAHPVLVPATYQYAWYPKWGNYKDGFLQPFLVNCRVPRIRAVPDGSGSGGASIAMIPSSVSLVEQRCDKATNNMKVMNKRPAEGETKKNFAVCVKGLDFLTSDLSVRLVEWLELLHRLGADKVFLYELEIHPNISKVLQYYQDIGLVELNKISLPGNQPNLEGFRHLYLKNKLTHKRQNELIPYNDCLYRNLYTYKYLVLLDTDEVIMPMAHDNWATLMDTVQELALVDRNYTRASYNVRNVYFLDDLHDGPNSNRNAAAEGEDPNRVETHLTDQEAAKQGIPKYLHMLNHVYRSRNYTKPGQYVKCFHNTERVVSLHNHFPLNCFGSCTTYSINVTLAQLQHYRKDCVGPLQKACNSEYRAYTTKDTTIWRYKEEIIDRTAGVLTRLGFFN